MRQNNTYRNQNTQSENRQVGNPRQMNSPFDMFDAMASKMMKDFGNFGGMNDFGSMGGMDFPKSSMMSMLDRDDGFGSFGGVFGNNFMNMDSQFNKMLTSNSGNNQVQSQLPGGGMMQAQTYCYSQQTGQDGKPVTKKYFAQKSRGLGKDGEKIGEMQELYHNSGNQRKVIAQERTIDGKGRRIVKSKIGNGKNQLNKYQSNLFRS